MPRRVVVVAAATVVLSLLCVTSANTAKGLGDADSGNHERTTRTKKGSKKRSRRGHQASASTNGGDHNEL